MTLYFQMCIHGKYFYVLVLGCELCVRVVGCQLFWSRLAGNSHELIWSVNVWTLLVHSDSGKN